MINRTISFFQKPFPIVDDRESKWAMIWIPGVFTAIFLNVFQPFTIHNGDGSIWFMLILSGYGLVGSLLLFLNEYLVWDRFRSFFHKGSWTIGKNLLWFGWQFLTLSFGIYAYWKYWCCGWASILNMEGYPLMLFRTVAIGIFPVIALMSWQWIKSIRTEAHQSSDSQDRPKENIITFTSAYHNEQLRLLSSNILFLEAADNYVAIHYKDGQGMAKKLIRSSLSRIEHELESFPYFMRCHRSFLINLDQVKWIKGNSKKPEVHLRGVDAPIPVARKKAAILNEQLQRLSP